MKEIRWNESKNEWLKRQRNISFEEVAEFIKGDAILAKVKHSNNLRYSRQSIYIIRINDYAYEVPFVENEECIFLKTIYPSRKYKKLYFNKLKYEKEQSL